MRPFVGAPRAQRAGGLSTSIAHAQLLAPIAYDCERETGDVAETHLFAHVVVDTVGACRRRR